MKHFILPLALVAMLLAFTACSIEEVDPRVETGTLLFRAIGAADSAGIAGQLSISGEGDSRIYSGEGWLVVSGLPLDSNLVLHFTPADAENWFAVDDRMVRLDSADPDTLQPLVLHARADSLRVLTVRTMGEHGELAGLPLWLDGVRWPQDSPATLYVDSRTHSLMAGNDGTALGACFRADTSFQLDSQPTADFHFQVPSVELSLDPGEGGRVVLNGQWLDAGLQTMVDPALGNHLVSAYRPGHVADPVFTRLSGLCGGAQSFSWTPVEEGYTAGLFFPDFAMPHVVPGQAGDVDIFHLGQSRGRLTLVTFWYATCVNCLLEMPHFQSLLEEYGPRGFRVVAVDPYPTDYPENYPAQVEDYDFTFVRDAGSPPVAQLAQVGAFPTNFMVLPDGRIQAVYGGLSEEALEALLLEYLPE
jgi:thiol-disulfide isomerase/thioredoxin